MEIEVSAIYLNLSPDKTRATLTCTRSDGGNAFMLIMKMEVLEQLKMAANRATRTIHDRMPVFLGQETLHPWLEGKAGTEILLPASAAHLRAWPVSRRVNSSKAEKEDRTLIEPIGPSAV